MHSANASAPDPTAPGAVEPAFGALERVAVLDPLEAAEPLAGLDVEVVGLGEFPPHAVTRTPLMSAAAASRRARSERVSRFGSMLSCIGSPSGVLFGSDRLYAADGFRTVSCLGAGSGLPSGR
jgi:hypothetical protein